MNINNLKTLLIFDFDNTILNNDSFGHVFLKLLKKEEQKVIYNSSKKNWVDGYNYTLNKIKSHGYSLTEFNKHLDELSLTKGMHELFLYIRENKNKYEAIILSSNYQYVINYLLKKFGVSDIFSEIICNPSREANPGEEEQFIYVLKRKPHGCDKCNPCNCKNNDYNEFCLSHNINNYDKVIFICDGYNDLCLAKNLGENDSLLVRKDFQLYKKLYENELIKNLLCKVQAWEEGKEIINYLKSNEK